MVNYKRVVCEVALVAALATLVSSAPAHDCDEKYFDQSQNGTENYRLNIDGVVIAIAPAETLMSAATDIDLGELLALSEEFNDFQKPKPPNSGSQPQGPSLSMFDLKPSIQTQDEKPSEDPKPSPKPGEPAAQDAETKSDAKPEKKDNLNKRKHEKAQRLKQRLASLILPLLKRSHNHHEHHEHN